MGIDIELVKSWKVSVYRNIGQDLPILITEILRGDTYLEVVENVILSEEEYIISIEEVY